MTVHVNRLPRESLKGESQRIVKRGVGFSLILSKRNIKRLHQEDAGEKRRMDKTGTSARFFSRAGISSIRRKIIVILKPAGLILLLPTALLLGHLAQYTPLWTEMIYARGLYPILSTAVGSLTALIPFSLSELLILLFPVLILTYIVIFAVQFFKYKSKRKEISSKFLISPLCVLSVLVFTFMMFCGLNYSRMTFAELNQLPVMPSVAEDLRLLCEDLVSEANALREELPEDEAGVMMSTFTDAYKTAAFAQTAYGYLGERYPALSGYIPRPKPVRLSVAMSHLNITGIFIPFVFEANVNVDTEAFSIPATMMHELSHYKGFMREEEANFIAYLACRESGHAEFQYSGTMLALGYSLNALYRADPEGYFGIADQLSEAVQRDRAANRDYWARFDTPVKKASAKVNDIYLKGNHQDIGIQSYGQMVDLLLADFKQMQ